MKSKTSKFVLPRVSLGCIHEHTTYLKTKMLSFTTDRDLYTGAAHSGVQALITVVGPEHEGAAPSPPLQCVAILDTSGSMEGGKLTEVKTTMRYLLGLLGPSDSLCIVSFNEKAETLLPLSMCANANFATQAEEVVGRLTAGGGTSIAAGLEAGLATFEGAPAVQAGAMQPVKAILLLTDGQDGREKESYKPLLQRARELGAGLFSFGFGKDHDAKVMSHLAESGGGIFAYIDKEESCGDAFAAAMGSLKHTFTKNLTVDIEVAGERGEGAAQPPADAAGGGAAQQPPAADAVGGAVELLGVHTSYPSGLRARSARVSFGALSAGERRTFRLTLALPPLPPEAAQAAIARGAPSAAHYILQARASYTDLATGAPAALPAAACVVARAVDAGGEGRALAAPLNVEVEACRARDEATKAMAAALKLAEDHQHEKAAAHLKACVESLQGSAAREHPLVAGLVGDLAELARVCSRRDDYEHGGRAAMSSTVGSHTLQKFTGVASPHSGSSRAYCSPSQTVYLGGSPSLRRERGGGGGGGGSGSSNPTSVATHAGRSVSPPSHDPLASPGPVFAGGSSSSSSSKLPPSHPRRASAQGTAPAASPAKAATGAVFAPALAQEPEKQRSWVQGLWSAVFHHSGAAATPAPAAAAALPPSLPAPATQGRGGGGALPEDHDPSSVRSVKLTPLPLSPGPAFTPAGEALAAFKPESHESTD